MSLERIEGTLGRSEPRVRGPVSSLREASARLEVLLPVMPLATSRTAHDGAARSTRSGEEERPRRGVGGPIAFLLLVGAGVLAAGLYTGRLDVRILRGRVDRASSAMSSAAEAVSSVVSSAVASAVVPPLVDPASSSGRPGPSPHPSERPAPSASASASADPLDPEIDPDDEDADASDLPPLPSSSSSSAPSPSQAPVAVVPPAPHPAPPRPHPPKRHGTKPWRKRH